MEKSLLQKVLQPSQSALLVWDVQNMLVDGIFNKTEFLEKTTRLIDAARGHSIPVFFSKITPLPERFESPVRKLFMRKSVGLNFSPHGLELAIRPAEDDVVIPKHTTSIFTGTHFGQMLRNAGLTTLILAGIATEIGVESSARDAFNLGFFPVIAADAVSSRSPEAHQRSLQNMERMFILLPGDEIMNIWDNPEEQ